MNKDDCLNKQNILDWLNIQDDDAVFCPYCLNVMTPYAAGMFLRCENKMCLFEQSVTNVNDEEWQQINQEIEQERGREVLEEMKVAKQRDDNEANTD